MRYRSECFREEWPSPRTKPHHPKIFHSMTLLVLYNKIDCVRPYFMQWHFFTGRYQIIPPFTYLALHRNRVALMFSPSNLRFIDAFCMLTYLCKYYVATGGEKNKYIQPSVNTWFTRNFFVRLSFHLMEIWSDWKPHQWIIISLNWELSTNTQSNSMKMSAIKDF